MNKDCLDLAQALDPLESKLFERQPAAFQQRNDFGTIIELIPLNTLLKLFFHLDLELYLFLPWDLIESVWLHLSLLRPYI